MPILKNHSLSFGAKKKTKEFDPDALAKRIWGPTHEKPSGRNSGYQLLPEDLGQPGNLTPKQRGVSFQISQHLKERIQKGLTDITSRVRPGNYLPSAKDYAAYLSSHLVLPEREKKELTNIKRTFMGSCSNAYNTLALDGVIHTNHKEGSMIENPKTPSPKFFSMVDQVYAETLSYLGIDKTAHPKHMEESEEFPLNTPFSQDALAKKVHQSLENRLRKQHLTEADMKSHLPTYSSVKDRLGKVIPLLDAAGIIGPSGLSGVTEPKHQLLERPAPSSPIHQGRVEAVEQWTERMLRKLWTLWPENRPLPSRASTSQMLGISASLAQSMYKNGVTQGILQKVPKKQIHFVNYSNPELAANRERLQGLGEDKLADEI